MSPVCRSGSIDSTAPSTTGDSTSPTCLTIFDWDDTILPTTWLRQIGVLSNNIAEMQAEKNPKPLSPAVQARLREIEALTIKCIKEAQETSTVVVITNSSDLWIPYTCQKYLPGLEEIFKTIYVSSARPNAPSDLNYHASMAVNWKVDKFRELVQKEQYDHVVSIGDGFSERCAVLALHGRGAVAATAVRLAVSASIERIILQLKVLTHQLPEILTTFSDQCAEMILTHNSQTFQNVPVGSVETNGMCGNLKRSANSGENTKPNQWNGVGFMNSLMAICKQ